MHGPYFFAGVALNYPPPDFLTWFHRSFRPSNLPILDTICSILWRGTFENDRWGSFLSAAMARMTSYTQSRIADQLIAERRKEDERYIARSSKLFRHLTEALMNHLAGHVIIIEAQNKIIKREKSLMKMTFNRTPLLYHKCFAANRDLLRYISAASTPAAIDKYSNPESFVQTMLDLLEYDWIDVPKPELVLTDDESSVYEQLSVLDKERWKLQEYLWDMQVASESYNDAWHAYCDERVASRSGFPNWQPHYFPSFEDWFENRHIPCYGQFRSEVYKEKAVGYGPDKRPFFDRWDHAEKVWRRSQGLTICVLPEGMFPPPPKIYKKTYEKERKLILFR